MIIDGILAIVAIASLGYAILIIVRHFPEVSNITVDRIPEHQQQKIKRQLLEDKLRRDFASRWKSLRENVVAGRGARLGQWSSSLYTRLRDLEQEFKIARKKDLSTHVSKTRSIEEFIADARQFLQQEEYQRAEQLLIEALKVDEHNVRVYLLLAQVYREQGDYDHARETLEFLTQLTESKDPSVYSDLASLALERGDLSTAQEDYQRSISLDPENYKYHLELAEVYSAMGHSEEALLAGQRSLSLSPNNPKILDFLIENSIILRDTNRAEEYLAKLIEVNPENGKIVSFKSRIGELEV